MQSPILARTLRRRSDRDKREGECVIPDAVQKPIYTANATHKETFTLCDSAPDPEALAQAVHITAREKFAAPEQLWSLYCLVVFRFKGLISVSVKLDSHR